jgi:hypothetical protein
MEQPHQTLELIPKSTAEKLDAHTKKISAYIDGHRKGAAEMAGYAYLAGLVLLEAKATITHGNGDSNAGFKNWVEARFKKITHRTATNWMGLAQSIQAAAAILPEFNNSPLLLGIGKINSKNQTVVLNLVRQVMDGKTMMKFLRDSALLRDPEKQKHHPAKAVSAQEANKAKAKLAKRVWDRLRSELDAACKVLSRLEPDDWKKNIDALVDAANRNREAQAKAKKQEAK